MTTICMQHTHAMSVRQSSPMYTPLYTWAGTQVSMSMTEIILLSLLKGQWQQWDNNIDNLIWDLQGGPGIHLFLFVTRGAATVGARR